MLFTVVLHKRALSHDRITIHRTKGLSGLNIEKVEQFYTLLNQSASLIQQDLDGTFIEGLVETGENIVDEGKVHVEDGLPGPETVEQLTKLYQSMDWMSLTPEEKKQVVQLALIKAAKEDLLQPNHQPTPDAIGVLVAMMIELFFEGKQSLHLTDLSVGTGNLLFTIYTSLVSRDKSLTLTGVDNDDSLIALASTFSALLGIPIELQLQDSLQALLINPADIMVMDLPIGYYPKPIDQESFQTSFEEGHSFSHYLLIEQSINYMKDGGFGFYLLPTSTFEAEEVKSLLSYVQKVGHVQGIIHLPSEWFKNEQSKKSIFIVQKKSENSKQAQEVLIANAPLSSDKEAYHKFIADIRHWKTEQGII